jgi:hypothetical protein
MVVGKLLQIAPLFKNDLIDTLPIKRWFYNQ